MNRRISRAATAVAALSGSLVLASTLGSTTGAVGAPTATGVPAADGDGTVEAMGWQASAYRGAPEVVPAPAGTSGDRLQGVVYVDADRDSTAGPDEERLAGVRVSNGRDVVKTDAKGRYSLPAFDNMTVFMTQPAGYQVPVDDDNVAQFHYHHLPEGTPEELKYGGLEPTGPLPSAVNFGVVESDATADREQSCVIAGDLQTYDLDEVGYARAGAMEDLSRRTDYAGCGPLFIGDVVGDDLSLYPEVRDLVSEVNGPVRFLPGNHDLDFDASSAEHSFDTFREKLAPTYFSYDVGQVHLVALNTVSYPCEDTDGLHPTCADPANNPKYNGRLSEQQLEWLAQDIAATPKNKLVVLASHIPLLTFADSNQRIHQLDQLHEVYDIIGNRKAVAVAGHTHSIENMKEGDLFQGWKDIFGIDGLPFPHIVAGAISGDWYSGQLTEDGIPAALGRDGGRPGLTTLDVTGNKFQERFTVTGEADDVQTQLGLNTPTFREWMTARQAWNEDQQGEAPELGSGSVVTPADLAGQTWLTTNFWMGATDSTVEVSLDGADPVPATRTQAAQGEDQLVGPQYADPTAVAQQLVHGGSVADRSMHLWRYALPADLAAGEHRVEITATDSYGREFTDAMTFTVTE